MRLPRPRLITLMTWVLIIAMGLGLAVQGERARVRERELGRALAEAKAAPRAEESMRYFLGTLGRLILEEAESVELLQVHGDHGKNVVSPTGKRLDQSIARRLAGVLLDPRNHDHLNMDDLPEPQTGVRLRRGGEFIDILMSANGGHQDVWFEVHPAVGLARYTGWDCFDDPDLGKIVEALIKP